jgi:hypothetical protein
VGLLDLQDRSPRLILTYQTDCCGPPRLGSNPARRTIDYIPTGSYASGHRVLLLHFAAFAPVSIVAGGR